MKKKKKRGLTCGKSNSIATLNENKLCTQCGKQEVHTHIKVMLQTHMYKHTMTKFEKEQVYSQVDTFFSYF